MRRPQNEFMFRVLFSAAVASLCVLALVLLWQTARALLVIFAGVVLAVMLRGLSELLRRWVPLSAGWALVVVLLLILTAAGLGGWLLADRVASEFGQLRQTLPASLEQMERRVRQSQIGRNILGEMQDGGWFSGGSPLMSQVSGLLSSTAGFVTSAIIILFTGLYLAAEPETYCRGLLRFIPHTRREKAEQVLGRLGYKLRWWLIGQAISMSCVTLLTTLGLWLLNIPLALALGISAGLLEFIPNFGPVLGAIPALLIAALQSPQTVLYVALLYTSVQLLESYLILPLVQRKAAHLPPALTITALFVMGVLFGFVGLLLAVPLTVVLVTLVSEMLPDSQPVRTSSNLELHELGHKQVA
jgi:predicted PurR-regulated permease PerM